MYAGPMWIVAGVVIGLLTPKQAVIYLAAGVFFLVGMWATLSGALTQGLDGLAAVSRSGAGRLAEGFVSAYVVKAVVMAIRR